MNKSIFLGIGIATMLSSTAYAQNSNLKGSIQNSHGAPIEAATVTVKELGKSTATSRQGEYSFSNIPDGNYTLIVKSLGHILEERKVTVKNGRANDVLFSINTSSAQLDYVEINGYSSTNNKVLSVGKGGIVDKDLPQAVQIINEQVIKDQQVNRLSDALKNANGIALGANRGGSSENFYARGYSLGANNIFLNGARTNNGGSIEASTLESVEILKGSAALLYGGVSGGAVVNMVTKKPKFTTGGEVSFRTGSYDLYKPTIDVYGPLSKKLAVRIISTYENAKSFRDVVSTERFYINPSLLYKISDRTELNVIFDFLKSDYTPDFGIGSVEGKINKSVGRNTFINVPWAFNNTKTSNGQVNLKHEFNSNWKLNALASYQQYSRDYYSSERIQANAKGMAARSLNKTQTEELTSNQQLNLTGQFYTGAVKHKLLVGLDADQSNTKAFTFDINRAGNVVDKNNNLTAVYDSIDVFNPYRDQLRQDRPEAKNLARTTTNIYRYGIFFQDLIEVTNKFKVLAGLRYTYQRTPNAEKYTYETGVTEEVKNIVNGVELGAKVDKAFSPKLGLIYQPIPTSSLYVSYANNFTPNTGYDVNYSPMRPSIIDQFEAGVKNDFFNGRLTANATYYKIKNNRFTQQVLVKPDGTDNIDTSMKEFSGKTSSDGFELDITASLLPGLNLMAGYAYNNMRYTETSPITKLTTVVNGTNKVTEVSGNQEDVRLVGTTAHTANGTIFYTLQQGSLKGLKLGFSTFYTGTRNAGWNNSKIQVRDGINRLIKVDGFTTFDFSAGYNYRKWSLLGKFSNITNEFNYYIHENYSVNPIPPRSFSTTVSYRF